MPRWRARGAGEQRPYVGQEARGTGVRDQAGGGVQAGTLASARDVVRTTAQAAWPEPAIAAPTQPAAARQPCNRRVLGGERRGVGERLGELDRPVGANPGDNVGGLGRGGRDDARHHLGRHGRQEGAALDRLHGGSTSKLVGDVVQILQFKCFLGRIIEE
eukprot:7061501-Prymnesium_polylepis.1